MKKRTITFLMTMLLIISVFNFASCSARPELDLEESKENLEDFGYTVRYLSKYQLSQNGIYGAENAIIANEKGDFAVIGDILSVNDIQRLSSLSLAVINFKEERYAKIYYDYIKSVYDSSLSLLKSSLEFVKAAIREHLYQNTQLEKNEDSIDEIEDSIDEIEDLIEKMQKYVIGKSGKTVWFGDKQAIEDTKG